jgi:NAD(P)-dependent dehydrogenase (short-subunit alcohol dehydrogenase family)
LPDFQDDPFNPDQNDNKIDGLSVEFQILVLFLSEGKQTMARILITGSADGLGLMAARSLISDGHTVVLHARNEERRRETMSKINGIEGVVVGDLSDPDDTRRLADRVNSLGHFDAIIHNAGVYQVSSELIFAVNTLAPYILTALVHRPKRLIYLSSQMHAGGRPKLDCFIKDIGRITYSDSKLHVLMLAKAVARKWRGLYSNAVDPGWVPTKMGGKGAPDDLEMGYQTQTWLATSNDASAKVTGRYFYHRKERSYNVLADDIGLQEQFLKECEKVTGVSFPVE